MHAFSNPCMFIYSSSPFFSSNKHSYSALVLQNPPTTLFPVFIPSLGGIATSFSDELRNAGCLRDEAPWHNVYGERGKEAFFEAKRRWGSSGLVDIQPALSCRQLACWSGKWRIQVGPLTFTTRRVRTYLSLWLCAHETVIWSKRLALNAGADIVRTAWNITRFYHVSVA